MYLSLDISSVKKITDSDYITYNFYGMMRRYIRCTGVDYKGDQS